MVRKSPRVTATSPERRSARASAKKIAGKTANGTPAKTPAKKGGKGNASAATPAAVDSLDAVSQFANLLMKRPQNLLDNGEKISQQAVSCTQYLYTLGKQMSMLTTPGLPSLLVDGFDREQTWEMMQLHTKPLLQAIEQRVGAINKDLQRAENQEQAGGDSEDAASDFSGGIEDASDAAGSDSGSDSFDEGAFGSGNDDDSLGDGAEEEDVPPKAKDKKSKSKPAGKSKIAADDGSESDVELNEEEAKLEDNFFKLDDMEKFVRDAEEREMRGSEDDDSEDIDFMADVGSESDDEESGSDAFEKAFRHTKDVAAEGKDDADGGDDELGFGKFNAQDDDDEGSGEGSDEEGSDEESSDEDDEDAPTVGKELSGSKFDKQTDRLKSKIEELEEEAVDKKAWQLSGEVQAKNRPDNSLLETEVEFEHTQKPAPVVTEEITEMLEDVIRRRIAEGTFDDVIRKVEVKQKGKKRHAELDQEQDKRGLGEVYEDEYREKVMGVEKPDELQKQHAEISSLFTGLCQKLDQLSNFHFTPKMPDVDIEVKTNAPAITMEEVIPLSVSNADTLTPGEVYKANTKSVKGEGEMTQEDRKRARQQLKSAKRKRLAQSKADAKIVEKLNPGMGNKYSKSKALADIKGGKLKNVSKLEEAKTTGRDFTNSTKMFANLQNEATSAVKGYKEKRKDDDRTIHNSKRLRL